MEIDVRSARAIALARCRVEVVRHDTGGATVILTVPPESTPWPVSTMLATGLQVVSLADLRPAHLRWIVHVPAHGARAPSYHELSLVWNRGPQQYHCAQRRALTPDEIRQLGFEPDEIELVSGELQRLGIPVEHEGADVRIDGHAVSRNELRALFNAAHGNVDEFLRRFAKMRDVFV